MGNARTKLKIACPGCRQKLDLTDLEPFARIACPTCGGEVIAPRRFGSILLEEPLGQCRGVGSYRALDLTLDREVWVQVLEAGVAAHGEAFQALARRAAPLNHPGVVPIYSCGVQEGSPYIVSQYMAGGPLARRLRSWEVAEESVRQGVGWALAVAGGIQSAAAQGVVHGAVGPSCIYLDGDGRVKLGEFGIDVLLCGRAGRAGDYAGEVAAYLSPEVLAGEPPTVAADVFGLGAVLYHVLGGQGPCGPVADAAAVRRFWASGQPPAAVVAGAAVLPQSLVELSLRMLQVDPRERPHDLAEVMQTLTSACKTRATAAARDAGRPRPRSLVLPALKAQEERAAAARRRRRHRWVDALIAAGVLAAVALGALAYVREYGWPAWLRPLAPSAPGADGTSVPASAPQAGAVAAPSGARAADPAPEPVIAAASDPSAPAVTRAAAAGAAVGSGQGSRLAVHRPQPDGVDFLGAAEELGAYLKALPAEARSDERERIELVGDVRKYLVRLMKYVPFAEGKDVDVRLRSGRVVRAAVPYCNETQVAIRPTGETALHMVPWRDLAFEQFVAFLEFYLRLRLDQGQTAGGSRNPAQQQEAGEDCLRLAVLCDWYGREPLAARYGRQAVGIDPKQADRARRLLPSLGL